MMTATQRLDKAKFDLMAANRILARENVVDGYGHVSIRHPENPDQFLLSRSRSPELVEAGDIMEFLIDGTPVGDVTVRWKRTRRSVRVAETTTPGTSAPSIGTA
jgi:ribulose-5-phosphate 4-epimerase/fuculose-1-phosphate aldolase